MSRSREYFRFALSVAFVLTLTGCTASKARLTQDEAIQVALQEASRNGFSSATVDSVDVWKRKWQVHLSSNPLMPGGHATVLVSDTGDVLKYQRGL